MPEANKSDGPEKMTEYEKQRMKRIQENRERMKALGLNNLVASTSSFMGSVPISNNKKGKKKMKKDEEDDEDYKPKDDDFSSSSESGEADDDDYYHVKPKPKKSTPSKKASKSSGNSSFVVDDDDALMKAIALSLQDSPGFLDVACKTSPQRSDAKASSVENTERKQIVHTIDSGKRKRKNLGKQFSSRVQMTEDELILHFFQFDETGKGGINLRDLRRVAASHDFTWSDEEMDHMIRFFDSDVDGKLSLEDFTKIVERCNMRQGSENEGQA